MSILQAERLHGKEVFSFSYHKECLESGLAILLDPDLDLFIGPQYVRDDKANFGLFMDSSPDRWGKVLMERREAFIARSEGRRPMPLMESDYLLGVYDLYRMGGLRFKLAEDGPFRRLGLCALAKFIDLPWIVLGRSPAQGNRNESERAALDSQVPKPQG